MGVIKRGFKMGGGQSDFNLNDYLYNLYIEHLHFASSILLSL